MYWKECFQQIKLSKSKWILESGFILIMINPNLLLFKIQIFIHFSKEVVALLMACLIRPDGKNQVSHRSCMVKSIVINSIFSCSPVFPVWQYSSLSVDILQDHGIVLEGGFLQVSDKLMTVPWTDEICYEKHSCKGYLLHKNENSHQNSRLVKSQESKEVESFIVRLFEQMMNPTLVLSHQPETPQVTTNARNHPRNGWYGFHQKSSP